MQTLVIIGNGMAANRVLEELGSDHQYDAIQVIGDEHIPHYNRIMLSPLLANETTLAAITPHDDAWYQERRIEVILGDGVKAVNAQAQQVETNSGRSLPYSDLVFATGSRSFIPPVDGADHPAVIGFRTMSDVDAMVEKFGNLQHATVIGAGLLGVEAAVGLKLRGVDVTLLHRNPVLMNRQLDATASSILEASLAERGIDVRTGTSPVRLHGNSDAIQQIEIKSKLGEETLDTQLVVFATGIAPNIELATDAGITTQRGICVNEQMKTCTTGVYALGECCEFDNQTYGLVAPIWDQAKVLAATLKAHQETTPYKERTHLTKLKVSGLDMHSIGEYEASDGDDVIATEDLSEGIYRKLVIRENKIVGVLCVGDVTDSHWYYELMSDDIDISSIRDMLIFGQAYCEQAA